MSEEAAASGQGASKIKLRKQMISYEESSPATEPLFVNYAQVAQAGGSAYIDVGVIALDEILSASGEATFLVLNRLVMSRETLAGLGQQISKLLEKDDGVGDPTP